MPYREPAEDRYTRDPVFKRLVDTLYIAIRDMGLTPTEVREAAILAAIIYETKHVTPLMVLVPERRE